jgi:hypothetical protein
LEWDTTAVSLLTNISVCFSTKKKQFAGMSNLGVTPDDC